jgi:hypothetical protein
VLDVPLRLIPVRRPRSPAAPRAAPGMTASCPKTEPFLSPRMLLQQTILSRRYTDGTNKSGGLSTRASGSYSSLLDIPDSEVTTCQWSSTMNLDARRCTRYPCAGALARGRWYHKPAGSTVRSGDKFNEIGLTMRSSTRPAGLFPRAFMNKIPKGDSQPRSH